MTRRRYIGVLEPSAALKHELARETTYGRCREMARSARASMERVGVRRLRPKLDPWSTKSSATHLTSEQAVFGSVFAGVRDMLQESHKRPLLLCFVEQDSCVPSNPVLLNVWYYLSVTGHLVQPRVVRASSMKFIVQLVAM